MCTCIHAHVGASKVGGMLPWCGKRARPWQPLPPHPTACRRSWSAGSALRIVGRPLGGIEPLPALLAGRFGDADILRKRRRASQERGHCCWPPIPPPSRGPITGISYIIVHVADDSDFPTQSGHLLLGTGSSSKVYPPVASLPL